MAAPDSPAAAVAPPPRFARELDTLIRARYPLVYLVTWEELRLDAHLDQLAQQHGKALWSWTVTRGLRRSGGARTGTPESEGATEPRAALEAIAGSNPLRVIAISKRGALELGASAYAKPAMQASSNSTVGFMSL